jgi:hypothetical protein
MVSRVRTTPVSGERSSLSNGEAEDLAIELSE